MDDDLKKKVIEHYNLGQGSIQDIARVYRLDVDEVLEVLGMQDMMTVQTMGDLIGQEEAGLETTLQRGTRHKVPYNTD